LSGRTYLRARLDRGHAFRVGLVTAAGVVVLDQVTKVWAHASLRGHGRVLISGFLRLTYSENTGAAFSSFTGSGPLIGVIGVGVIGLLVYLIGRSRRPIEVVALGLILGGALGNVADRVLRGPGFLDGAVVDWIDLWIIPTFNVADASLNIGVATLLLVSLLVARRDE
jgi:signal peptidase II